MYLGSNEISEEMCNLYLFDGKTGESGGGYIQPELIHKRSVLRRIDCHPGLELKN